jgi:hypothetical protein
MSRLVALVVAVLVGGACATAAVTSAASAGAARQASKPKRATRCAARLHTAAPTRRAAGAKAARTELAARATRSAHRTRATTTASAARATRGAHRTPADPTARRHSARRARRAEHLRGVRRVRTMGCVSGVEVRLHGSVPVASPVATTPAPTIAATPAAPATAPATPTSTDPVAPPPPPSPPTAPVLSTLGVGAYDMDGFLLRLTRPSVAAGTLTIFYRNNDVSDHNLWIEGPGDVLEQVSDTVGEGGGATKTLPVTAGTWRLFCSLPDHGAMTHTFTVTP